jgi:hypothetical protein
LTEHANKIRLIGESEAAGALAEAYDAYRAQRGRPDVARIIQCFSHRPDFLRDVLRWCNTVHFSEGHLSRRTKEAIASWVSWINRCPY